jgi:Mg/Co/Ni transporter MgtE
MHLSPEISKLLDAGKDAEAIELLTNDLVALRARRVSAATKASKKRSRSKTQKAKDKAGIKSPEQQAADKMVEDMLKMQQGTTIEFAGEDKDDVERPDTGDEETTTPGVARKVS